MFIPAVAKPPRAFVEYVIGNLLGKNKLLIIGTHFIL